jgi:hypothetical protein
MIVMLVNCEKFADILEFISIRSATREACFCSEALNRYKV